MKRLIKHICRWNEWRKYCLNGKWHKFLVLIGVRKSPTMMFTLTKKEAREIGEAFKKGFEEGLKEACNGD